MPRYAISDLHGCPKTFRKLLHEINLTTNDELFLLGDYLDRGPDGMGVIKLIWTLQIKGYTVTCLRGNHEQMFFNAVSHCMDSDAIPVRHHEEIARWVTTLAYYCETPGYLLVHAGLDFLQPDPLGDTFSMLWIRDWYNRVDRDWLGDRVIVHGHTPEPVTSVRAGIGRMREVQRVCIDSGCTHSHVGMGWLTALNLDSGEGTYVRFCEH